MGEQVGGNMDIEFLNSTKEQEQILACLKNLYETPVGTVALDRDFGLDWAFLDLPLEQAKGRFTIEVIEKTRLYEPRVEVSKVTFTSDSNGVLKPKVVLRFV